MEKGVPTTSLTLIPHISQLRGSRTVTDVTNYVSHIIFTTKYYCSAYLTLLSDQKIESNLIGKF